MAKRELQQLEMMKRSVQDEKFLFSDEKLSAAEKRRQKMNEKLLELAEERQNKIEAGTTYQLPEPEIREDGKIDRFVLCAPEVERECVSLHALRTRP